MATNISLDDEITALTSLPDSSTLFVNGVNTAVGNAFRSTSNAFGSAATRGLGGAGNIPVVPESGTFDETTMTEASTTAAGIAELATTTEISGLSTSNVITARAINQYRASTAGIGMVRRATPTEVANGSNVNAYVAPADVPEGELQQTEIDFDYFTPHISFFGFGSVSSASESHSVNLGVTINTFNRLTLMYHKGVTATSSAAFFSPSWRIQSLGSNVNRGFARFHDVEGNTFQGFNDRYRMICFLRISGQTIHFRFDTTFLTFPRAYDEYAFTIDRVILD